MSASVADLLAMWCQGLLSRTDLHARLLELGREQGIDRVMADLPAPWREELATWIRNTFDNDRPPEDFVWVANTAEPPGRIGLISAARSWLADNGNDRGSRLGSVPTREEIGTLLSRYFDGPIPSDLMDQLLGDLAALMADEPRRRGQVRMFAPENQVSWGEAWREEYATRAVPTPLDHALMLAAKSRDFPPPRPYCPDQLVGTWELVSGEDGPPPPPRPRWELAASGILRATGTMEAMDRWCVHRGSAGLDRLWLQAADRPARTSIVIAAVSRDALELLSPSHLEKKLVFRRV